VLDLVERAKENVALTYSAEESNLTNQSGGERNAGTGTVD